MSDKDIFKSIVNRSVTEIIIPSKITSIGVHAFSNCTSLANVSIPNNILSIGNTAFYNCTGLTSITIPNSVTSIGSSAFQASGLTDITIPNSVTSIGASAFKGCSKLTNATIGSGVSNFGASIFANSSEALYIQTIRFNQPSGMAVTLPTAGSSTGMFYCKTASTLTVYTDNETIKNYNYATDNVTPTFYHLDGSAWA